MAKKISETRDDLETARELAEEKLQKVVDRAVKAFLKKVNIEAARSVEKLPMNQLTAAGGVSDFSIPYDDSGLPSLGEMYGWWILSVSDEVKDGVQKVFSKIYRETASGKITATSLDGLADYMSNVSDRLVRGITPPLPEAAMDQIRTSVTQGAVEGWSRDKLGQRIATELSWEKNGAYWRAQKATADSKIDTILDAVGKPGNPLRESMKRHDPIVSALIRDRNLAISHLDAEASYWQTRAVRIARTESTGAFNYGHLRALHDENWPEKTWIAGIDGRTRDTHADANGQTVKVGESFRVGNSMLQMPGDPSGSAEEIINCRCTIIGNEGTEVSGFVSDDSLYDPV